jgi:hypothetical protein
MTFSSTFASFTASLFGGVAPSRVMGAVWLGMGAATMLFPGPVLRMSFQRQALPSNAEGAEEQPAVDLLCRCFGAQAVMCGILLLTAKMDATAYKIWGVALLPFFAFDYLAWRKGLLTDLGALGDLGGNIVFLVCSVAGAAAAGGAAAVVTSKRQ